MYTHIHTHTYTLPLHYLYIPPSSFLSRLRNMVHAHTRSYTHAHSKMLGAGNYEEVYKATLTKDGQKMFVAVKTVKEDSMGIEEVCVCARAPRTLFPCVTLSLPLPFIDVFTCPSED